MKAFLIICAGMLFLGITGLPIVFFTFLRIVVTIGAVTVVINEYEKGLNFWVIIFGMTAILFNPLIPIYLQHKETWIPWDIICGILFIVKAIMIPKEGDKNIVAN